MKKLCVSGHKREQYCYTKLPELFPHVQTTYKKVTYEYIPSALNFVDTMSHSFVDGYSCCEKKKPFDSLNLMLEAAVSYKTFTSIY